MKTLGVVLAVAIMLACIYLQESSATPVSGTEQLEEVMDSKSAVAAYDETFEESWKMPYTNRHKRGFKCRFCCGCCRPGVCGVCCRF
ncbi:hepcidin-like [Dunckerocampus dactyliophorus]|uniref:hepcidin-like n=1 Tax=Dunckerocampus dactyliophorus TaxID=161453 RepID=UPI0024055315|nr:hepcidin-like [Dunckerocampus dactyliophorus]XP_054637692.1 hepcidin-like [Dunckerocampus dactyliophorus]